jgi:hypothetical protein
MLTSKMTARWPPAGRERLRESVNTRFDRMCVHIDQNEGVGLVRPEVKGFIAYWPHVPTEPRTDPTGPPPDPTFFGVQMMLLIGMPGKDGADAFDCFVCTPRWLADRMREYTSFEEEELAAGGAAWYRGGGRLASMTGTILMPRWSKDGLLEAVDQLCGDSTADDWATAATRIGRVFRWEYQYRYDEFVDAHPERFAVPPWPEADRRPRQ